MRRPDYIEIQNTELSLYNYQCMVLFLLLDDQGRTKDIENLDEEDFLDPDLQINFINLRDLARKALCYDPATYIATYCSKPHNIDFMKPENHCYPSLANYDFYLAHLRKLTLEERQRSIYEEFVESENKSDARQLMNIELDKLESKSREKSIDMNETLQKMHDEFDGKEDCDQKNIIFSNMQCVDSFFSTIRGPYLFVLGARPGIGKSAFSLQMAWQSAKRGQSVGFISLEMTIENIAKRLTSHEKKINLTNLCRFDKKTIAAYYQDPMDPDCKIYFEKPEDRSLNNVIKRIHMLVKRDKVDFVIIDHLRNITYNGSSVDEHIVIRKQMEALYFAAHTLKVPLIILTQLNRECEKPNVIPKLNWLQGSSAIEQYADAVMFQYVTGEDPITPSYDVIFRVMKSRGSSKVSLPGIRFEGPFQTFSEITNVTHFQPKISARDYIDGKDGY